MKSETSFHLTCCLKSVHKEVGVWGRTAGVVQHGPVEDGDEDGQRVEYVDRHPAD